ncbi:unnamed protein product, partial [marine sediment metagenome]
WRGNCIGISNSYFDGTGTLMPVLDYDGKNVKTRIRKDVKLLQKGYRLGDAWVYETRRGFHVYFLCDRSSRKIYEEMLHQTAACKGFKRATSNRGYAVLRVSAKYTDFDIKFLYVLSARDKKLRRMPRKAHLIQALLALGEDCGTHFASLYPQWANYQEDPQEWKPARARKGKRIRKTQSREHYNKWLAKKGITPKKPANKSSGPGHNFAVERKTHGTHANKSSGYVYGSSPPATDPSFGSATITSVNTGSTTIAFDSNTGYVTTTT